MRRAFLFAGIAAGALLVFTTAATVASPLSRNAKLARHMDKVQSVAYCRVGYEIASSFPSYASRHAVGKAKRQLISQSDKLNDQKEVLGDLLRGAFKTEAINLGMDGQSYDDLLSKMEAKAEVDAVISFQSVEEPNEFLNKLDEVCAPYI